MAGDPSIVLAPGIDLTTGIDRWILALDSVPLVIVRVMAIDPSIPVLDNVRLVIDPETAIDQGADLIDLGTDLAMGTGRIDPGTGPVVLVRVTDQVWETDQAIGLVLAIVRWTLALDSGRPAIVRLDTGRPIIDLPERGHLGIVHQA